MSPPHHRIEVRPAARKALLSLSKPTRRRVQHTIDALAEQPRPRGTSELTGRPGTLRLRAGTQELIYTERDNVILIIEIAHRSSPWYAPAPEEGHNPVQPKPE